MSPLEANKDMVKKLCEQHGVKSLYSFGSANTNQFNAGSDIDLLVELGVSDPIKYTDRYFSLKFGLEEILDRHIDLLESQAIRNPGLREAIDRSMVLIYG